MTEARCFPPQVDDRVRVLVLGSMPGQRSLDEQRYYAHPRNSFWPIMARLFEFDPELDYSQRLQALKQNRVGLWDVMAECHRPGSLDSAIVESTIEANDFSMLLHRYPGIGALLFNGGKAEQSFRRYVWPLLQPDFPRLQLLRMPSTSPAHASLSFEQKLEQWQRLLQLLAEVG